MVVETSNLSGDTPDARMAIANCLKAITALNSAALADPENRVALAAIAETIKSLLARSVPIPENEVSDSSQKRHEAEAEGQNYWRARVKSNSEKQEKKARLEQREAILRDLRSRITRAKGERSDFEVEDEQTSTPHAELPDFESRRQRASYWTEGSVEWARQLLGIELGMTTSEKRQKYLEMVKVCHPDHNRSIARDAIQLVNAAWEIVRQ
ncbi:MAG: J domain-containing protein [Silvanigrellaceae bacterium]